MLGQLRRLWSNVNPAFGQRLVFAGPTLIICLLSAIHYTPFYTQYCVSIRSETDIDP